VKIANWTFEPNKGLPKPNCVSSVMTELSLLFGPRQTMNLFGPADRDSVRPMLK
jgi:hypothetical protein